MLDLKVTDLSKLAEDGYKFELKLPGSGEGTGAFVTVRGDQSKIVKQFGRKKYSELNARQQAARRRGKEDEMSLDEAEELAIESAVVRVIDWQGISEGGQEIPFNKENATRIFKEHAWIREQVMEESQQLLNFQPE